MVGPLAAAMVLVSAGAAPAEQQHADVPQLVRDACIDTGLDRAAFERLAQERGWRRARITSDTRRTSGWNVVFREDGVQIMLSQIQGFGPANPSSGSICTVSVERAASSLETDIAALADSLGLESEGPIADLPSGAAPVRAWSLLEGLTLSYAAAADGRAAISISRQIVTHEPAPVSPPGN